MQSGWSQYDHFKCQIGRKTRRKIWWLGFNLRSKNGINFHHAHLYRLGTLIGGLVTYAVNDQQFKHQIGTLREEYKTEFMAETTARHFLSHKSHTDRSFDMLVKHLHGFEEDELRKILVRASAVLEYHSDGTEWWYLLTREAERVDNFKNR